MKGEEKSGLSLTKDRYVSIPFDPGTNTYRYAKSWIIAEPVWAELVLANVLNIAEAHLHDSTRG